MLIDSASAKALAIIVILSNQQSKVLEAQYPLHVVDQGETWLVKGTPFTDKAKNLNFCQSHVILRKADATIIDFGFSGRMALTKDQQEHFKNTVSKEDYDRVFGPRTDFDPANLGSTKYMDVNKVVNGGLINSADAAIDYALVLLRLDRPGSIGPRHLFEAKEIGGDWHVAKSENGVRTDVAVISRTTATATLGRSPAP